MRILICSDTHGYGSKFYDALDTQKELDLVIHCGDIEGQEMEYEAVVRQMFDCPFVAVAGNNDYFAALSGERELELEGIRILVTHGHHYYVSMSTEIIKEEAIARDFDVVMFGHTHRPLIEKTDEIVVINPGSLTYPRQEGRNPSFAIMEIDEKREAEFTIHYLD